MNDTTFTASDLANFYGSENWYRVGPLFGNVTVTDGVHFIMERGCSWMATDILAVVKVHPKVRGQEFVSIKFRKSRPSVDDSAVIEYGDGNGNVLYRQPYESTDCPVDEISFYFANDVLLLASEY